MISKKLLLIVIIPKSGKIKLVRDWLSGELKDPKLPDPQTDTKNSSYRILYWKLSVKNDYDYNSMIRKFLEEHKEYGMFSEELNTIMDKVTVASLIFGAVGMGIGIISWVLPNHFS